MKHPKSYYKKEKERILDKLSKEDMDEYYMDKLEKVNVVEDEPKIEPVPLPEKIRIIKKVCKAGLKVIKFLLK